MNRVFVDMDGVLVDFDGYMKSTGLSGDEVKKLNGAYLNMTAIEGAISSVRSLIGMGFDVWIATKPPTGVPHAYSDKAAWVLRELPELKRKIIVTHDKGLLGDEGDYLCDDRPHKANCEQFKGKLLRFVDGYHWPQALQFFREVKAKQVNHFKLEINPNSMKLVPASPSYEHLKSMAIRFDHGLGIDGYYDTSPIQFGLSHAVRLENTINTMRQLYEEAIGEGFYDLSVNGDELVISDTELVALKRFNDTCEDDGTYDIHKDMINKLSEIGLIRWKGSNRYEITKFGEFTLNSNQGRFGSPIGHGKTVITTSELEKICQSTKQN